MPNQSSALVDDSVDRTYPSHLDIHLINQAERGLLVGQGEIGAARAPPAQLLNRRPQVAGLDITSDIGELQTGVTKGSILHQRRQGVTDWMPKQPDYS